MKKIFQKLKNHKYRNLICVLCLVLVFVVLPNRVFAQINSGQDVLNWGLYWIGSFFGMLVTFLIGFLMRVAAYNDFTTLTSVQTGWKLMRDVCNMFFIVIMMLIAVSTIIRYEAYNYKKILPTLLIKAVLINFSLMFCGLLIDASQVVTLTFVDAFKGAGEGNFIAGLGIDKVYQITRSGSPHTGTTMTLIFGAIMLAIATVVIGALVVVFLGRIIAFWLLIILSPFTFLASSSGGMGSKYADQWWTEFTKYLIVGPVLAFFLWLSLSMMRQTMMDTVTSKMRYEAMPSIGDGEAGTPKTFFAFMIATAMLLGSLVAAQQIGTAGSGAAGKTLGGLKAAGAFVAKGIPSYGNELFALGSKKLTGVAMTLNPMDYYNSWKKAREQKSKERLLPAQSHLDDIAHYGVARFVNNIRKQGISAAFGEATKQGDERRELEKDKIRKDLGGEENAAGKKRLKEKEEEANKLNNEITNFEKEVKDYKKETDDTVSYNNRNGWTDENGNAMSNKEANRWQNARLIKQSGYFGKLKVMKNKYSDLSDIIANGRRDNGLALTAEVIKEEQQKADSKSQEIKNKKDGYLGVQEMLAALGQIENRLEELKAIESEPGGKLDDYQIREEKDLESKKQDLEKYRDKSIGDGQYVSMLNFNDTKNIRKYGHDELKGDIKRTIEKGAKELQKEVDYHKGRVEVMKETQGKAGNANLYDYDKINERMADRRKKIEKMDEKFSRISGPDKFYRSSAHRALVEEERKKIADVKEATELLTFLKKAQHEKNFYKLSAIAKQMAMNGDDNEFLNGFKKSDGTRYKTGFGGMREFFQKEICEKMKVDEQDMLALATDIGYINESVNHWNTARMTKNEDGKWRWNTQDEQTTAALAELMKKGDRALLQKLNRFGFGEETQDEDGKRTFSFTDLGKGLFMNLLPAIDTYFAGRQEGTTNVIFKLAEDMSTLNRIKEAVGENFTERSYKLFKDVADKKIEGVKGASDSLREVKRIFGRLVIK